MDGEWEPPMVDNPEYKGEWKPKQKKNPAYKVNLNTNSLYSVNVIIGNSLIILVYDIIHFCPKAYSSAFYLLCSSDDKTALQDMHIFLGQMDPSRNR